MIQAATNRCEEFSSEKRPTIFSRQLGKDSERRQCLSWFFKKSSLGSLKENEFYDKDESHGDIKQCGLGWIKVTALVLGCNI